MKKDVHPTLQKIATHCACGESFVTLSTQPEIRVTICSKCHPYFTGSQKYVDTAGRIEKFQKKYKKA